MLLFQDGFDAYGASADFTQGGHWDLQTGATFLPNGGVNGGGAVQFAAGGYLRKRIRAANSSNATLRGAFRFRIPSATTPAATSRMFYWRESNANTYGGLAITTTGQVGAYKSDGGTFGGSIFFSVIDVCDGAWHTVQFRTVSGSNTTGKSELWVDDIMVGDEIGQTGQASGDVLDVVDEVWLRGGDAGAVIDDVWLWDDEAGPGLTGAMAQVPVIRTRFTNGAGSSSQFAPVGAATNHEAIDEQGFSDLATTYNQSGVVGHTDLFNIQDHGGAPDPDQIIQVTNNLIARTEPGATRTARSKMVDGANTNDGEVFTLTDDAWVVKQDPQLLHPDGSAWTKANLDTTEFGYEVTG